MKQNMDNINIREFFWKIRSWIFCKKNTKKNIIACKFIKEHTDQLVKQFSGKTPIQKPTDNPIGIFMAGSPGAGKTEFSKRFLEAFFNQHEFVRIDADEIRDFLPKNLYNGKNAHVIQNAATIGVQKLYDHVLKTHKNFILDATFSHYKLCRKNIARALKPSRERKIFIFYVYQDPKLAWEFTKAREYKEGRHIRKKDFIRSFLDTPVVINKIKSEFGSKIKLHLFIKNNDNIGIEKFHMNISNIDSYIKERYDKQRLLDILS
ncbi:zeta toxin family protein [Candidatus Gracilibacteria bacterium]|nr:zeta toxin family protein [Candidatus Gracilibacteria bacterium]